LSPYKGHCVLYPGFPGPQAPQARVLGQDEVFLDLIGDMALHVSFVAGMFHCGCAS